MKSPEGAEPEHGRTEPAAGQRKPDARAGSCHRVCLRRHFHHLVCLAMRKAVSLAFVATPADQAGRLNPPRKKGPSGNFCVMRAAAPRHLVARGTTRANTAG